MPAKIIKTQTGRLIEVKAIQLKNGNILILQKMPHNPKLADWVEAKKGTSDYKRWSRVIVEEEDPRKAPEYIAWRQGIEATPEYKKWARKQTRSHRS